MGFINTTIKCISLKIVIDRRRDDKGDLVSHYKLRQLTKDKDDDIPASEEQTINYIEMDITTSESTDDKANTTIKETKHKIKNEILENLKNQNKTKLNKAELKEAVDEVFF